LDAYPREAWLRLGQQLKQRRPQLDPRYRIRRVFAKENGLTDKTVQEIENAYRETFRPEMISVIETAYQLQEGSIERFLAGGKELEVREPIVQISQVRLTTPAPPEREPGVHVERYDERHLRVDVTVDTHVTMDEAIASLGDLSPHERGTVAMLRDMRYEPAEVAGAILLLRGLDARRAAQSDSDRRNA
jgi:hypothetical protein